MPETSSTEPLPVPDLRDAVGSQSDPRTCRRIEEASLNAWPAMQQMLLDGWLLRFAQGFTKRANCVTPLYPAIDPAPEKIRYCENVYARERLKTIFRLTSISDHTNLDALLEQRAYRLVEHSLVLTADLEDEVPESDPRVRFVPLDVWLDAYIRITHLPRRAHDLHRILLSAIPGDCAFALLDEGRGPVACAVGVHEQDLMGLFDVVVQEDRRNAGLGHALVAGVMGWGQAAGARMAYLQMLASNDPATRLYDKLGFEQLYRYWYRISA